MRRIPVIALAVVALAGCGGGSRPSSTSSTSSQAHVTTACAGRDLGGSFSVVRGSAGAGQIVYLLRLRNVSSAACYLGAAPRLRLLGADGRPLPTRAAWPGGRRLRLAPGATASTTARFSPDVPGVGEGGLGGCEPVAHELRVTPAGGGSARVPVRPPTPVCEHGRLGLKRLT